MTHTPEIIVTKVGTAAISMASGEPDKSVIGNIVHQIAHLSESGHKMVHVSSGAVGFGQSALGVKKSDDIVDKQLFASVGQVKLIALHDELFAQHGLHAAQALLTKSDFGVNDTRSWWGRVADQVLNRTPKSANQDMVNYFNRALREPTVIPVINENDTTATWELRLTKAGQFTDNDELAGLVARQVKASRLIILSNLDGVYTANPKEDKSAKLIQVIDFADPSTLPHSTNGKSGAGRGGMETKFATAEALARSGVTVHIANSREPDVIRRIVDGELVGTKLVCSNPGRPNKPPSDWTYIPMIG